MEEIYMDRYTCNGACALDVQTSMDNHVPPLTTTPKLYYT